MKKKSLLWNIIGLFVKDPGALSAGLVRLFKVGLLAGVGALVVWVGWEETLTPIGVFLVVTGLSALEKFLKEKWGYGLALIFALMLAQPAQAQTKILELKPSDFAVGGGSMFGEESTTFSLDAAFAAVHWNGIALFGEASTGVGIEIHPATIISDGNMVQFLDNVDWRLWSLNRIEMSALQLPGEIWELMYLGSDLLVAEGGGNDYTGGFDARFVYGLKYV